MLSLKILSKNNYQIFFFVLQHCTIISDCSILPLGCNGENQQKLQKIVSFVPRLLKEKYFERRYVITEECPHFLRSKPKPLGSTMQQSPVERSIIIPYTCSCATSLHCSPHHRNTINDSLHSKQLTQAQKPRHNTQTRQTSPTGQNRVWMR